MIKYRITEAVCVAIAVLFIFSSVSTQKTTTLSANEITDAVIGEMNNYSLIYRDKGFIKEKLGIDTALFSSVSYYSTDDVMDVSELFVCIPSSDDTSVYEVLKKYASDRYNLFNGYANEQAMLLDSYVLDSSWGAVLFCVGENADDVKKAFLEAVKGES